jgi:SAM-dependent methyltransferase
VRWRYGSDWRPRLWRSAGRAWRERGWFYVARLGVLWATFPAWRLAFHLSPRWFEFRSQRYRHFLHRYNATWSNERAVEIPIVWKCVQAARGRSILEVGNVLSHYFAIEHPVVDRYEAGENVINQDVVSFASSERFDLIVSVSTLEHVGWDEGEPADPAKLVRAVENLRSHLKPGGQLVATLPLGYNPHLDALLAADALPFSRYHYLVRHGMLGWSERRERPRGESPYGIDWPGPSTLVVATLEG